MTKISREETFAIAKMSCITIHENEIASLISQLDDVLSYAQRVQEVTAMEEDQEGLVTCNSNVFRQDSVVPTNPAPILAQAPQEQEGYFVVPAILDHK